MIEGKLKAFVHQHTLAVIATFGEDYPESAVIEFGSDGLDLVFDTKSHSRKYDNLLRNPHVSLVIGWDSGKTLQYEGVAALVTGGECQRLQGLYFAKNPSAKARQQEEGTVYFKVTPKWLRLSDFSVDPWQATELAC